MEIFRFLIQETTRFISPEAVSAEWAIVICAALLVWLAPFGRGLFHLKSAFRRIANQRRTAIVICGLLPVLIRLSLLGVAPIPEPSIHDEFSHLLLADTLAHGRLTNPPHPLWKHFESIHIIQQPTYNSMYPPAQGAFLALGEWLFHEPWAGVLISVALMFAALCWMMQGWLPLAWAFFGTLTAILAFGLSPLWISSYMSGAVPAIGGALLIGAAPRIKRYAKMPRNMLARNSALVGIGVVILMNSRPFEGMFLTLAALLYMVPSLPLIYRRSRWGLAKVMVPAGLIFLCGLSFTAYYNWRVTGSATRMPYEVNRDTYGWPENLGFLPVKHVVLQHQVLEDMYLKEVEHRNIYNSAEAFLDSLSVRAFDNWAFFIGPVLTLPFLLLPWILRDKRTRPLVIFLGLILFLNLFQMVLYPYHLAPEVPIIFAIAAQGVRHIYVSLSRANPRRGVAFAFIIPLCLLLTGAMKQEAAELGVPLSYWENAAELHRDARASIQQWLSARPRKQLVIVRYASWHSPDQEWVYNGADIDGSKVVWAREMDEKSDARLIHYFRNREVWLLEADQYPQHVVPYFAAVDSCGTPEPPHALNP